MLKASLDFIVIGAQKSGTTSLFEYLKSHPEITVPAAKEVPFFSHDEYYSRDWGDYLGKAFPRADPITKWGTVTPHYMVGGIFDAVMRGGSHGGGVSEVPRRIQRRLPGVRLIALLRDPVERARSHHAMARMEGYEPRSFADAVDELLHPAQLKRARALPDLSTGYITWGEYARILSGYLECFDHSQLLIVFTSALQESPAAVMKRVYGFLGVDDGYSPPTLGRVFRPGASTRKFRSVDLNKLQRAATDSAPVRRAWRALPFRTRRRIDYVFDSLNYRVDLWNRSTAGRPRDVAGQAESVDERLRAHFAADSAAFKELLGQPVPWAYVSDAGRGG